TEGNSNTRARVWVPRCGAEPSCRLRGFFATVHMGTREGGTRAMPQTEAQNHARNGSSGHTDPASARRYTRMAAQARLGLLPERRDRPDPLDGHHRGGDGPRLSAAFAGGMVGSIHARSTDPSFGAAMQ